MDANLRKKILKGKIRPEHVLDLHGLSQLQAHDQVIRHVEAAYQHDLRLILIITGKGTEEKPSVLKNNIHKFLDSQEISDMIVFTSEAAPQHGGSGAFYVYLRKKR